MNKLIVGSVLAVSLPVITFAQITADTEAKTEVKVQSVIASRAASMAETAQAEKAMAVKAELAEESAPAPSPTPVPQGSVTTASDAPQAQTPRDSDQSAKPSCWPAHLRAGDFNADGYINGVDKAIVEFGFATNAKTWKKGDTDCNKKVDFDDIARVDFAMRQEKVCFPQKAVKGDANLDGKVDGADYRAIDRGFKYDMVCWQNGDFNMDGVVNFDDYAIIDYAFNSQGNPGFATAEVALQPTR